MCPQPSSLMRRDGKRLFRDAEAAFLNVDLNICVVKLIGSGINSESRHEDSFNVS